MAALGILCPPLPGHINPMAVLAAELTSRGHRVTFLGFPDMQAMLPAGVHFQPFGGAEQPLGSLQPFLDSLSRVGGLLSVRRMIGDLARFANTICRTLPEALEVLKPDALIVDQSDAASNLVALALGIPFATIANALPLNREPAIPPPVLPWRYDPSPPGIRRNLGGYRVAHIVERPITKVLRRHAALLGQSAIRDADDCWSDRCQITQCVRGLDFPREQLPPSFHYVGPFRAVEATDDLDRPDNRRPLIFCSLGTLQGSRAAMFQTIAKAASDLGVKLLIAHGGLLGAREIAGLERLATVRAFVPQRPVLARSALAVTHAGFNTVMDALTYGVPMVALPIAFEQPGTGARLARVGAAQVLQRRRTRGRIRAAMERVLSDPSYRTSAGAIAEEIAAAGGVSRAADLIEQSLGLFAPKAAATKARAAPDDAHDDSRSESR